MHLPRGPCHVGIFYMGEYLPFRLPFRVYSLWSISPVTWNASSLLFSLDQKKEKEKKKNFNPPPSLLSTTFEFWFRIRCGRLADASMRLGINSPTEKKKGQRFPSSICNIDLVWTHLLVRSEVSNPLPSHRPALPSPFLPSACTQDYFVQSPRSQSVTYSSLSFSLSL